MPNAPWNVELRAGYALRRAAARMPHLTPEVRVSRASRLAALMAGRWESDALVCAH
jgi:hypothetical protein